MYQYQDVGSTISTILIITILLLLRHSLRFLGNELYAKGRECGLGLGYREEEPHFSDGLSEIEDSGGLEGPHAHHQDIIGLSGEPQTLTVFCGDP